MSTIEIDRKWNQGSRRVLATAARTKKIHSLVAALIVAAPMPGCVAFQRSSAPMTDQKITANVEALIDKHPDLEGLNGVHVQTLNHVVYLTGEVSDGLEARIAESIAWQAKGVTRVENTIYVTK